MIFDKYNLNSMPFSQGYLVNELAKQFGANVVEAGEVAVGQLPEQYTGTLVYIKLQAENVAEVIWRDYGGDNPAVCVYQNIDGNGWKEKIAPGNWVDTNFTFKWSQNSPHENV